MKKFKELLFLKQLKGIGNVKINKKYIALLDKIDSIEECVKIIKENDTKLTSLDIEKAIKTAEDKYNKITKYKEIHIITVYDEEYPKQLNDLKEKRPVILYAKGNIEALREKSIAVVGTREPSVWSQKVEFRLVQKIIELSNSVIISGLALGCDKIAHEATLSANARTVAVLPSGVNVITPASHNKLAIEILEKDGCLISEYEPDAKVTRSTYVERDSIIAALSDVTFVIQCGVKSGTMHTVEAAIKINKKVACYYTDNKTKGNYDGNKFILETKDAVRVSNTEELVDMLNKLEKKDTSITKITNKNLEQISMFDIRNNLN